MAQADHSNEGRTSAISSLILSLYRHVRDSAFRRALCRLALKLEGGAMFSLTIRRIYKEFHDLDVGLYTIGPCEAGPELLDPGTTIGRYSSIYYSVRTLTRDPAEFVNSRHGLYFEPALEPRAPGNGSFGRLNIGNDVFIGHNVVVLHTVGEIGDGAVIGAGSVVHSRVPPYAIVTGNPARVVRYRFSEGKIKELLEGQWWRKTIDQVSAEVEEFRKPLEQDLVR